MLSKSFLLEMFCSFSNGIETLPVVYCLYNRIVPLVQYSLYGKNLNIKKVKKHVLEATEKFKMKVKTFHRDVIPASDRLVVVSSIFRVAVRHVHIGLRWG